MTDSQHSMRPFFDLRRLADQRLAEGDFAEALRIHEQLLQLLGAAGDFGGQAVVRTEKAWVLECMGRFREALGLNRQSLQAYRRAGHRRGEAMTLRSIARLMAGSLRGREAVGVFQEALAIQEEEGETRDRAVTLGQLAHLYASLDQKEEARAANNERLEIVSDLGDERERVLALADLALLSMDEGEFVEAIAQLREALAYFVRAGDLDTQSALLSHLARCHAEVGERKVQWRLLQQRREIADLLGLASEKADVQAEIGIYKAEEGNVDEALPLLRESLEQFSELGNEGSREVVLRRYARLKSRGSRFPWLAETWILFKDGFSRSYRRQTRTRHELDH